MSSSIPNLKRFRANLGANARTRRDRIFDAHAIAARLDGMMVRAALTGDIHTLPDDIVQAEQIHQWLLNVPARITLDVAPEFKAELEGRARSAGMSLEDYVISRCESPHGIETTSDFPVPPHSF